MNDAAAPVPSPPPPSRSAWRAIAAVLPRSRGALAAAAVTAVVYLILAVLWVLFASLGASRVGRAACGEGCAVVAAADGVSTVATKSLVVLGVFALVAALWYICAAACNIEAAKVPAPNNRAPANEPVLWVLMLGMLAFLAFVLLILVGFLLKVLSPVKGSHGDRSGSVIIDVGVLSLVVLNCFVVLPALAPFVWRTTVVIWQRI